MKIKIQRKDLLTGIQRAQGVVEKRNTMPILSHILMQTQNEGISIFATDLEMGIQGSYPAKVVEEGRLTVSARKLYEIVREFPEGVIDVSTDESNWVIIKCQKSHFKIAGLPPQEFPSPPSYEGEITVPIDPSLLSDLIRKTVFSSGENDSRYILNGVLVQLQNGPGKKKLLRLVATDGHRLAIAEGAVKCSFEREEQGIVPRKAIMEIKKSLEEGKGGKEGSDEAKTEIPELVFGKNQLIFRQGSFIIATRLMEGNYPNYKQVIPVGNNIKVTTHRESLEGGLRRVSLLAREKTLAVKFNLEKNRLLLSASSPEIGEAKEEIETDFSGEEFATGFNARYFIDILAVLEGENVALELKDPFSPCLIKEEARGFLSVVMPMRS